jgi:glycosyltransferase involved in cell wall biosynthesis
MAVPLRVVLALESSGPGGAENMVLHLAKALRRRGDDPIVASFRPGWMTERAEALGFPSWVLPQRSGIDLRWVLRFARRLRREQVDVLHSHEFAMNAFGGAAALLARTASVATIHGRHWATGRPRRALAYRGLRRLGMPVVAVSEDLAEFLVAGLKLPRSRLEMIHNGIPLPAEVPETERAARRAQARAALGIPAGAPLVVAIGNLYPVKDHATLLRAVAQLPAASVAIAGRGNEEEPLRHLAQELGLAEQVHLLGLRDDVDTILTAADIFVQPSLSEGLPLAVLEAMGFGLPIVATRVDPEALAAALTRVIESADCGTSMGTAGRERAAAEFSVERMTDAYRQLYYQLRGRCP